MCPSGEYSLGGQDVCHTCPADGVTCNAIGIITLLPAFFRPPSQASAVINESTILLPCFNAVACVVPNETLYTAIGTFPYSCAPGYMGPLCGVCDVDNNYQMYGKACAQCGSTLESYGVRLDPRLPGPARVTAAHAALRAAIPHRHLAVLRGMRSHLSVGDYLLVHAGVRPGVPLDAQDPADLMWIREDFLDSGADHGKVVVHGHTIVRAPEVRRNRIGIDTGAFATGRLTALVLEGEDRRFLST
jgi:hypothetical protein